MKPYYAQDGIVIYHGDCREVLPLIPETPGALVLTDPPYGVGKAEWDSSIPLWWMEDAARIAPTLGLTPSLKHLLSYPKQVGRLQYRGTLAAHLTNGMTRGTLGWGNWIPCLVYTACDPAAWCAQFGRWCQEHGITRARLDEIAGTSDMGGWWASALPHRAQIPTIAQWERLRSVLAPPSDFDTAVYANPHRNETDCRDFIVGGESRPDHPSPKPINVMRWLAERLPGYIIIDPFMGSGSTIRAAFDLQCHAIGIEIEERYCEIAANRLRQMVLTW